MAVVHQTALHEAVTNTSALLVGDSAALRHIRFRVNQVAPTDATVLLLGETGTGKGLVAQLIHEQSRRAEARFVHVDCAALPPTLIESELFGHERGAFTDAITTQVGRFELAHGGTVFLDEVGELPLELQSKLLRVLQFGEFERLGSSRTIRVDVRIIAATNRRLADEVAAGTFRRDLFYRLNVFPIDIPPLRQRAADLPLLCDHVLAGLSRRHRKQFNPIPAEMMSALAAYDWPGNVRELENVLERAVIVSSDGRLQLCEPLDPPERPPDQPSGAELLVDVERAHIMHVLSQSRWRIEGPRGAATALGLRPSTLRSRMRRLGVGRHV